MRSQAALAILFSMLAFGQNEAALREYFEGRTVRSKLDLPGTHEGLDINFKKEPPMEVKSYRRRLNEWGPAVEAGREIVVTAVRVKGKNIEFQLGGGGLHESSSVSYNTTVRKSSREESLDREISRETDAKRKDRLKSERDRLRSHREREERRLRAEKARLEEIKRRELHEKAFRFGSRINLWFPNDYLKETVPSPDELMSMLDQYIDFSPMNRAVRR